VNVGAMSLEATALVVGQGDSMRFASRVSRQFAARPSSLSRSRSPHPFGQQGREKILKAVNVRGG